MGKMEEKQFNRSKENTGGGRELLRRKRREQEKTEKVGEV